jgi:hypothetical protein
MSKSSTTPRNTPISPFSCTPRHLSSYSLNQILTSHAAWAWPVHHLNIHLHLISIFHSSPLARNPPFSTPWHNRPMPHGQCGFVLACTVSSLAWPQGGRPLSYSYGNHDSSRQRPTAAGRCRPLSVGF